MQTRIETRNGDVSITSLADSAAEKSLVSRLVTDLQGVSSVKSQLSLEIPKAP